MWRMLQQPEGDDYVVATGKMISVQEFADMCFAQVGLDEGLHRDRSRYYRPAEVEELLRPREGAGGSAGSPGSVEELMR